jgi:hypothetical protein
LTAKPLFLAIDNFRRQKAPTNLPAQPFQGTAPLADAVKSLAASTRRY